MGTSFMNEPSGDLPSTESAIARGDPPPVHSNTRGKLAKALYLYVVLWPAIAMLCWRFNLFTSFFRELPYLPHLTALVACLVASFVLPIPLWKRFLFFGLGTAVGLLAVGFWYVVGIIVFGGIG
jgi:hypothetical protein